jgi:hypothetical protein
MAECSNEVYFQECCRYFRCLRNLRTYYHALIRRVGERTRLEPLRCVLRLFLRIQLELLTAHRVNLVCSVCRIKPNCCHCLEKDKLAKKRILEPVKGIFGRFLKSFELNLSAYLVNVVCSACKCTGCTPTAAAPRGV